VAGQGGEGEGLGEDLHDSGFRLLS
jgi:hypothetical protein